MNLIAIILIVFLLLFFGTVCFGLYVWWKKSVFTREKFSFAGLAAFSFFSIFVLTSIYAQQPPWLAVIGLIKQWRGLPYEAPQALTTEQNILSLILVGAFLYLITYLHSHWNGAKSINQYSQEQNQQPLGLIGESLLFLRSVRNPDLLAVYKPDAKFLIALWKARMTASFGTNKQGVCWNCPAKVTNFKMTNGIISRSAG